MIFKHSRDPTEFREKVRLIKFWNVSVFILIPEWQRYFPREIRKSYGKFYQ